MSREVRPVSARSCAVGWMVLAIGVAGAGCSGGKKGNGVTYPVTCPAPQIVIGTGTFPATKPTTCQKPVVGSSLPADRVQHLGVHKVGETVSFNVPDGTGSITIVSQAASGVVDSVTLSINGSTQSIDNGVVPTAVTAPNGTVYYDDVRQPSGEESTWHEAVDAPALDTAAMIFPNTTQGTQDSQGGYPSGTWHLTVNDYAYECATGEGDDPSRGITCSGGSTEGRYDISVVTKPQAPATGTIDLGIYLATKSVGAAYLPRDPNFTRYLSTLSSIYANAGVCIGTATIYDLPDWAKDAYATGVDIDQDKPCDNYGQMFTLSQPGNTLNFFFVDDIGQGSGTSSGTYVGIDGAIPAPSSFGGTVHTGAVVNASDLRAGTCTTTVNYAHCGADSVAYISAHEGGHWMGLYHTSEGVGVKWDPLDDTAQCHCTEACVGAQAVTKCCDASTGQNCDGSGTMISVSDCTKGTDTCGGGDNLMFWQLDIGSRATISDQQGQLIRSNIVVH